MSGEENYIKKIESGIRSIKLGTKTPEEAGISFAMNRLKEVNEGLYEDYMKEYKEILKEYEKKSKK